MIRRGRLWMALAACICFFGETARANAAPAVCVVRVGRPSDDAVLKRILGQTSDLPLTIRRVAGPIESNVDAALARADELARSRGARAVVWFTGGDRGEIVLYVSDPVALRLFVHRVGRDAGSRSARLEAASLIVRDALQSILDGKAIGFSRRRERRDDGAADALAPPLFIGSPPPRVLPVRAPRAPGAPWSPFADAGFRIVFSHTDPSFAVHERLGLQHRGWELGLALTLGATDVEEDAFAALLVRRHALGVFVGRRWTIGEQLTMAVELSSGAALFLRSTRPRVSYLSASASSANARAYVGPEARVIWAPFGSGPRLSLGLGADVVFFPPAFRFERLSAPAPSLPELALWPVQPHFTASVELGL